MAGKRDDRDPEALLPLTPTMFHVLLALADGDRHGYGIGVEVDRQTEGRVKIGPGTKVQRPEASAFALPMVALSR